MKNILVSDLTLVLSLTFNLVLSNIIFSQVNESTPSGFSPLFDYTTSSITDTNTLVPNYFHNTKDRGPTIPPVNYTDEPITDVFQTISESTGWSIFCSEDASKKKVSFWAKNISALELLKQIINLAELTYYREGNTFSVMTYKEYSQNYGVERQTISLQFAKPSSIQAVIEKFKSEFAIIEIFQETNTIIIYELPGNLPTLIDIVKRLDTPTENILAESINLKYADCQELAEILSKVYTSTQDQSLNKSMKPQPATSSPNGKPSGRITKGALNPPAIPINQVAIYAASHANQLIVVALKEDINKVKALVKQIDIPGDNLSIRIISLEYADAEAVAETLQKVFNSDEKNTNPSGSDAAKANIHRQTTDEPRPSQAILGADFNINPYSSAEIIPHSATNQIIVKAYLDELNKISTIIDELDTFAEPITKPYHLIYIDAAEVYHDISNALFSFRQKNRGSSTGGMNRSAGSGTSNNSMGRESDISMVLVEKSNSLILTGPPSIHRIMCNLCKNIDVPGLYKTGTIEVYKIQYASIQEIANTLKELLDAGKTEENIGHETQVGTSQEMLPDTSSSLEEQDEFVPQIDTKISVNESTNSIVVQATSQQQREIAKLIKTLDIRRKQVLIEALIMEVSTNDYSDVGVELDYKHTRNESSKGAATSFGLSVLDYVTREHTEFIDTGFNIAILSPTGLQAIIHALEGNDQVRIQSSPQVLVNDNEVGQIESISEEPTKQTNQGQSTTTTSFGDYVQAGTQFAITPHISDSNDLSIEYTITLSSFGEKAEPDLPPARNTSTINSKTLIPNGHTIVVGGIERTLETESISKVPFLGDIPLISALFRKTTLRKQGITTYLFITTTIINSNDFIDLKYLSKKTMEEATTKSMARKISIFPQSFRLQTSLPR